MDIGDQLPKPLSCLPACLQAGGGRLYIREELPLFRKEGLGEIFTTICLFNYGHLSNVCFWRSSYPRLPAGKEARLL